MRISFILPADAQTGGMRVIATYAHKLAQRGHQIVAIQPIHARPTMRERLRALVRRGEWLRDRNRDASYFSEFEGEHAARSLKGSFLRIKLPHCGPITDAEVPPADVVVATWWETAEWVETFAEDKGVKAYLIQHYEAHIPMQPAERVDATLRAPFRKIVVAQWLANLIRDRFGDEHHDTIVIPNAISPELFHAPPRGRQPHPTVGFMYSQAPFKGSDIAIEAIRRAALAVPDLRVTCFGLEALPPITRALLPKDTAFHLRPDHETLRQCYASCDAWLFASRVEGFGLPILEAMACRTPVIGTPTGAAPDLVEPGGGILVPMEDPAAMAEAITTFAAMPEDQWRVRSDTAQRLATGYTWDDATDRFEAALREITASKTALGSGR